MSKRVVVVGGGYGGVSAAKACDKAFDVTLIAGRDKFHHDVGGMRASVVQGYHARLCPPYDKLLARGKVLRCEATRLNPDAQTVTVSTGEDIPYDFLILATGMLHPHTVGHGGGKVNASERVAVFEQARTEISNAADILVVGGGPVGIEMSGEIREAFPEKKVTLVTSKGLMASPGAPFPEKFGARLKAKLEAVGVTVHTDAGHVDYDPSEVNVCGFIPGKRTYRWNGGEVEADLCIVATGSRRTPPLYRESGLESWLDERGFIKVERTFEVKGAGGGGKVFAIGDCNDLPLGKYAFVADMEGAAVVTSITASASGKPLKDVVPSVPAMAVVPVGSNGGVSALPMGFVVGDYMTAIIKSRGLLCTKFWRELGAGPPPTVG